jgi:hypothetical protein
MCITGGGVGYRWYGNLSRSDGQGGRTTCPGDLVPLLVASAGSGSGLHWPRIVLMSGSMRGLAIVVGCDCIALLPCLTSRFDRYGWSESGARIVPQLR